MGDEPADRVRDTLLEVAAQRPDLTLAAFAEGLEVALRSLSHDAMSDPERLAEGHLSIEPEPEAGVASIAPAPADTVRAMLEQLSRIWRRDVGRAPSLAELLDAIVFVVRPNTSRYVPGERHPKLRALQWATSHETPTRNLAAVLQDAAATGYATTADLWLDYDALSQLVAVPALRELDVAPGTIANEAWPALGNARTLRTLRLEDTRPGEPPWPWLGQLTSLEELYLARAEVNDQIVPQLGKLRALRTIDISRTTLTDAAFAQLELPNLTGLFAGSTQLGDLSAIALATSAPLERADYERSALSNAGLAALSKIASLNRLAIEHSKVTPAGFTILADFPALATLGLSLKGVAAGVVGSLASVRALTSLVLWDATANHVRVLASCKTLRRIALPNEELTQDLVEALASLPSLRELDLDASTIDDRGIEALRVLRPDVQVVDH